jgi:predicted metal-binding protein
MKKFDKYIQKAEKMGAIDAVIINSSDIVIDPRTLLKCMYGCETWGKNWTCPSVPNALRPWEFSDILEHYKTGILIHCDNKRTSQKISYELERDAFVDGYYFAFSMSDCDLCKDCKYPEPCKHPKKARPALQGLGIDVYATVRKQGLPIKTLKSEDEEQNWYSLVLIE